MKNIKFLSAAALLATLFIGGQVASAEDGIREEDLTIGASSLVELATSTEPGEVLPPDEGPSTGPYRPVGILGITSATNLLFPQITLNGMIQTVDAQYVLNDKDKTEVPDEKKYLTMVKPDAEGNYTTEQLDKAYAPGYSVVDKRGTGAGWTLSATLSHFVKLDETGTPLAEDSEDYRVLKGTRIDFPAVDGITVAEANPTPEERVNTVAKTVAAGGDEVEMVKATKGQGRGIWEFRYDPAAISYKGKTREVKPIKLTVPADNYAGQYQATMTWNLKDSPDAPVVEEGSGE